MKGMGKPQKACVGPVSVKYGFVDGVQRNVSRSRIKSLHLFICFPLALNGQFRFLSIDLQSKSNSRDNVNRFFYIIFGGHRAFLKCGCYPFALNGLHVYIKVFKINLDFKQLLIFTYLLIFCEL